MIAAGKKRDDLREVVASKVGTRGDAEVKAAIRNRGQARMLPPFVSHALQQWLAITAVSTTYLAGGRDPAFTTTAQGVR